MRVTDASGLHVWPSGHSDDIDSCKPIRIFESPRSSDLLRFELVLSTSTTLALGDLLVGVRLIFNFVHKYAVNSTEFTAFNMRPTAVRMADKLRILVPVKRVIDYAVCFHFHTIIRAKQCQRHKSDLSAKLYEHKKQHAKPHHRSSPE